MKTKTCNICNEDKAVELFYVNAKMKDGYQNRCIDCSKAKSKEHHIKLMTDPVLAQKEKDRHRDKFHRLGYGDKYKPSPEQKKETISRYKEKFPEKISARNATLYIKPKTSNNELHHWSYNEQHYKDVIELSVSDHNLIHRYITYDQEFKKYRTRKGTLLDTKEKHLLYIELVKNLI